MDIAIYSATVMSSRTTIRFIPYSHKFHRIPLCDWRFNSKFEQAYANLIVAHHVCWFISFGNDKKTETKQKNTDLWTAFYIAYHPDRNDNHIDIDISSEYLSKLQFLYFIWPFPWTFYIMVWHLSTTKRLARQNAERFCIVLERYDCIGTVMKWPHSGIF